MQITIFFWVQNPQCTFFKKDFGFQPQAFSNQTNNPKPATLQMFIWANPFGSGSPLPNFFCVLQKSKTQKKVFRYRPFCKPHHSKKPSLNHNQTKIKKSEKSKKICKICTKNKSTNQKIKKNLQNLREKQINESTKKSAKSARKTKAKNQKNLSAKQINESTNQINL